MGHRLGDGVGPAGDGDPEGLWLSAGHRSGRIGKGGGGGSSAHPCLTNVEILIVQKG